MFKHLTVDNWRQFSHVDVEFHPRLTVLTGTNGSGKTTLLHLLNRHWGWDFKYLSSPRFDAQGLKEYWTGFWGNGETGSQPATLSNRKATQTIGNLTYADGNVSGLGVPASVSEVFDVSFTKQQKVNGVYVPSHRPPYIFQKITEIPVKLDAKQEIFDVYLRELRTRFTYSGNTGNTPNYQIKRSLISLATFGYGNVAVERNEEAVQIFEGFQQILKTVLPMALGFRGIRIRVPDVLLSTTAGDFPFDAVSGGVAALIDMAWQIHLYSQIHSEFVVVIDEPEAHLHPALQQRILPDLLQAFPHCQFVVATHSPLIVTSCVDSSVYVLKHNESGRVESTLLSEINRSGTADEILMNVLGVPSTVPQWAQRKIDAILNQFTSVPLTQESLATLKSEMNTVGMGHFFPEVLAKVAGAQK